MRIYTQTFRKQGPKVPSETPSLVLVIDNWNDFGFQTLFNAFYFSKRDAEPVELGQVKVLQRGKSRTKIEDGIAKLPDEYCSLGQTAEYYAHVQKLSPKRRSGILTALRDIRHRPSIAHRFEEDPGFKTSLLRENEALRLYEEAAAGRPSDLGTVDYFTFRTSLPNARHPHEVDFDFREHDMLPNRVLALIGKNGTGKTHFLRRLADVASRTEVEAKVGQFVGGRPRFRKVVAVSYSAFDDFTRESQSTAKGYAYCGLYHRNGRVKSRGELWKEALADVKRIGAAGRKELWERALDSLLGKTRLEAIADEESAGAEDEIPVREQSLSSGELFLLAMMSRLVSIVRTESLVVMDEPEMHLHPNAIGDLVRTMRLVAEEFSSFVIIATHSPLVLQQIPSRYVRVLQRIGNTTTCTRLDLESFGENLTTLTESVFHAADEPRPYLEQLEEMVRDHSLEEIEEAFDGRLSFNARSFARSFKRGVQ